MTFHFSGLPSFLFLVNSGFNFDFDSSQGCLKIGDVLWQTLGLICVFPIWDSGSIVLGDFGTSLDALAALM